LTPMSRSRRRCVWSSRPSSGSAPRSGSSSISPRISSVSPPAIGGSRDGQLNWRPLDHGRVLAILHNPTYTGTYVYGRTRTRNVVLPGEEPQIKGRTRRVVAEDWPYVLHD